MTNLHSTHWKQGFGSSDPPKTTKMTKMAGVTQEKAWFRKGRVCSSLNKATHPTSPISDPTLKFFMWGSLLLENKGEGTTYIKNVGLHWGPLHSFLWVFLYVFFFSFPKSGTKNPERPRNVTNIWSLVQLPRTFHRPLFNQDFSSGTKKSAQRGSFGPDIPVDIRPKTSVRPSKSWKKTSIFGTDIPDGHPWKNFGLKNFGLIFRSLFSEADFMHKYQGRKKHGNEKIMVMFGAKFGWTFWPFLPRNPTFLCAVPSNCPELFARTFAWTLPFPCFFVP